MAHHGAELERRRAAEAEQASALVRAFADDARAAGLPVEALRAKSYKGASYRTGLRGWYLNSDKTIAVSEDGRFYLLLVPSSMGAWVTGATVEPQAPRMIVGEGARDGESIPLAKLLRLRLNGS